MFLKQKLLKEKRKRKNQPPQTGVRKKRKKDHNLKNGQISNWSMRLGDGGLKR